MSEMTTWPADWPRHHNAMHEPCDMLVGPCSCGAWHKAGEFELINGVLHRYDSPASWTSPPMGRRITPQERERRERVAKRDELLRKLLVKPNEAVGLTVESVAFEDTEHFVFRFTTGQMLYVSFEVDWCSQELFVGLSDDIPTKHLLYEIGAIDREGLLDRMTKAEREQLERTEAAERAEYERLKAKYEPQPQPEALRQSGATEGQPPAATEGTAQVP